MFLFTSKLNDCADWNKRVANKTDNCTVSYKHRTGRILVQINNSDCTIIPYPTVEVKYTWQVYVT